MLSFSVPASKLASTTTGVTVGAKVTSKTATLKGGATPEAASTLTVVVSTSDGSPVTAPASVTLCRVKPNVSETSWSFGKPPDRFSAQRNWLLASGSAAPQPAETAAAGIEASARSFGSGMRLVDGIEDGEVDALRLLALVELLAAGDERDGDDGEGCAAADGHRRPPTLFVKQATLELRIVPVP